MTPEQASEKIKALWQAMEDAVDGETNEDALGIVAAAAGHFLDYAMRRVDARGREVLFLDYVRAVRWWRDKSAERRTEKETAAAAEAAGAVKH